ncbi:hypothetical protein TSUD_132300 [Trifolium subterraneum]|uniref:Uncharacterized protein n=1 Tax=Trifolium subterraneum TaxID=3900 RepID=A0A2Z6PF88_TRISU|nr:hypothetical protein TSUD_132300 [Trifolium subterraneum]
MGLLRSGGLGGGFFRGSVVDSFDGFSFNRVRSSSLEVDRDFFSLLCVSVIASIIHSNSITDSLCVCDF